MSAELDLRTRYLLDAVGITLTAEQEAILAFQTRAALITGGAQAGKSLLASVKLLKEFIPDIERARAAKYRFPLVYWLVAEDYERTQAEFSYLSTFFATLGLLHRMSKRVDPGFIEIASGDADAPVVAVIRTKSAKDYRRLAMEAPMGIIPCEASQIDYESYLRLVERMAPHRAWLFMSGTMEGSIGWYPQLRQAWAHGDSEHAAFSLPSYSNIHLYPGGRSDPEILRLERESPDDFFLERIEGIPCPPRGLVCPEFNVALHVSLDAVYEAGSPVYLWYDPGYDHAAALEVAQVSAEGQVRIVDELYMRGLLIEEVIEWAQNKGWWVDVAGGAIDVAARAHAGQQVPVAQIWQQRTGLYMNAQKVPINEGTNRLKSFLKVDAVTRQPGLIIAPHCRGLISELGGCPSPIDNQVHVYRWKTDGQGNAISAVPEDRYNDAVKAVIYGLVDRFSYVMSGASKKIKTRFYDNRRVAHGPLAVGHNGII